jgi:hypothetical protein
MNAPDIFGLEGLADLGSGSRVDMRPTLLRVLTDLYVQRLSHTATEERHYTELALRLLEAVDTPTRVAVARRFARYLSPPLRVMQWLARDLPEVAGELRLHPLLQSPAPAKATPIAAAASTAQSDELLEEQLSAGASRAIDAALAGELNELFFAASAEERRLILLNINIVAPLAPGSIRVSRDPAIGLQLEAAALAGKSQDFAQRLAHALHIPREQAQRIARDDLGEPVVVVAKALGIGRDVLYRMLMFLNSAVGHSVERVYALAALHDEITEPAAAGMLVIWQALPQEERARTKHQGLTWDDETRHRARPGVSGQRRAPLVPRYPANPITITALDPAGAE